MVATKSSINVIRALFSDSTRNHITRGDEFRDRVYELLNERATLVIGSPRWRAVSNSIARLHGWPETY